MAEAGRRAAFEAGERERQAGVRLQEERERCKQAREEARRLGGALAQKDSQCGHELRRRDQELHKLRERLVKVLTADRRASSKTIKTLQGSMEVRGGGFSSFHNHKKHRPGNLELDLVSFILLR